MEPAINLDAVDLMLTLTQCQAPTLHSEPSGIDIRPWACWDMPDVIVCGEPMTVQVTFTAPSRGVVEVVAISMYQTPPNRRAKGTP